MKKLLAIILLLLPVTGVDAINPFKPYKPLKEIDYSLNWSLGYDSTSIAYKPESLTQRSLLPMGLLSMSILYNDTAVEIGRFPSVLARGDNVCHEGLRRRGTQ